MDFGALLIPAAVIGVVALLSSLRVLYEYERGVVFRLGRLTRAKGPGLIFLVPFGIERMKKNGPPDRGTRYPSSGYHYQGQRQREGQRGRVLSRRRLDQSGGGNPRLLLRDEPARTDHVAQHHRTIRVG